MMPLQASLAEVCGIAVRMETPVYLAARAAQDEIRNCLLGEVACSPEYSDDVQSAIPNLDQQFSLEVAEELVGVVVLVSDEVTLELCDLDLMIVQFTDELRLPMFGSSGRFFF